MLIAVLANEGLKRELMAQGIKEPVQVAWVQEAEELLNHPEADAIIDLLFNNDPERIKLLQQLNSKMIFVNAVILTADQLPENFIRINGWNTFLRRPVAEAATHNKHIKTKAEEILSLFNKKTAWTPDIPGFISARVIAMIINEGYFALQEDVSSKKEIDTAMKLGANYPYGPFEWSEKIGLKNIVDLLMALSETNKRYVPAALLKKEVLN